MKWLHSIYVILPSFGKITLRVVCMLDHNVLCCLRSRMLQSTNMMQQQHLFIAVKANWQMFNGIFPKKFNEKKLCKQDKCCVQLEYLEPVFNKCPFTFTEPGKGSDNSLMTLSVH